MVWTQRKGAPKTVKGVLCMDILAWIVLFLSLSEVVGTPTPRAQPWALVLTEPTRHVLQWHATEADCLQALPTVAPDLKPQCVRLP